jgi:hypothetical protein
MSLFLSYPHSCICTESQIYWTGDIAIHGGGFINRNMYWEALRRQWSVGATAGGSG